MRIFFSDIAQKFLKSLDAHSESASQVFGSIEHNFIRVDSIVPFIMVAQSSDSCAISTPEHLNDRVIGILHTHPQGSILPSDADTTVMKKLFPRRKATMFITEKRGSSCIIHPFLMLKNRKLTMLNSITV